jgi:hypothetical protein
MPAVSITKEEEVKQLQKNIFSIPVVYLFGDYVLVKQTGMFWWGQPAICPSVFFSNSCLISCVINSDIPAYSNVTLQILPLSGCIYIKE